jgi:hypothetical protein
MSNLGIVVIYISCSTNIYIYKKSPLDSPLDSKTYEELGIVVLAPLMNYVSTIIILPSSNEKHSKLSPREYK